MLTNNHAWRLWLILSKLFTNAMYCSNMKA